MRTEINVCNANNVHSTKISKHARCSFGCSLSNTSTRSVLADRIRRDPVLPLVLGKARDLLSHGLDAGSAYPQVWIRDLNTFADLGLQVNSPGIFREALVRFLLLQGPAGDIPDGYVNEGRAGEPVYRTAASLPGYVAHKNTVETDQESSLVLAVASYVRRTGDHTLLEERVEGRPARVRVSEALRYVLEERTDPKLGLVWGGCTIDWGDVIPETNPGVHLFPGAHRAVGIYHNASM